MIDAPIANVRSWKTDVVYAMQGMLECHSMRHLRLPTYCLRRQLGAALKAPLAGNIGQNLDSMPLRGMELGVRSWIGTK